MYCEKKGVLSNFENAIAHCTGEIIFLADQDDIWNKNKIQIVLEAIRKYDVDAVAHKSIPVDSSLHYIEELRSTRKQQYVSPLKILFKNYVQGCCVAFDSKYKDAILPFPNTIPMHDSWIAIIISSYGKMLYLDQELQLYRQHENNVTSRIHQGIYKMFSDRLSLLLALLTRKKSLKEKKI